MNHAKSPVNSYAKDGAMRYSNPGDPVYAPNSYGGPAADPQRAGHTGRWDAGGEPVRAAYEQHAQDDDWGQARSLLNDVMDDAARGRFVDNVVGHLLNGVSDAVLTRAFAYWDNVDPEIGRRIREGVSAKQDLTDPKAEEQGNSARRSAQHKA